MEEVGFLSAAGLTQKKEDSNQACIQVAQKHICKVTPQSDLPATRKGVEGPEWSAKPIAATNNAAPSITVGRLQLKNGHAHQGGDTSF